MIKRTISIGKPAYLCLQNAQLKVDFSEEDKIAQLPIEDIGVLVLDHPQITVTQRAMVALLENNAAVLWSDQKHLPLGMFLSVGQHHTFTEKLRHQVAASQALKDQLWKQLIQAKIRNQAKVLAAFDIPNRRFYKMADQVEPGDPGNLEARAAAAYWKVLYAEIEGFTRKRFGDSPNNLLNYGYAILRAIIARNLTASGCLPALGIHHRNKYNAFCLADDVMEPYRPFVDLVVTDLIRETGELPEVLEKEHKAELLRIPVVDVTIAGESGPLLVSAQRTTASLAKCFSGNKRKLLLPELMLL